MLRHHRSLFCLLLAAAAILACYAVLGQAKPAHTWKLLDIAGEASTAAMALLWLAVVLSSRPPGRVSTYLACGLGGLMLGAGADCLDEFFAVAKDQLWNHVLESGLTLAGMASLTAGLFYWRREQLMVTEHLRKRERLFRDHRGFDHLTQLANADYLRQQLRMEAQRESQDCHLLMLDIDSFHLLHRRLGQDESDRVLMAVTQILLLNLRSSDLLCRYAGDRFAVLLSASPPALARELAEHLQRAVAGLRHYTQDSGEAVVCSVRFALRAVAGNQAALLAELNDALERRPATAAGSARAPGGAPLCT